MFAATCLSREAVLLACTPKCMKYISRILKSFRHAGVSKTVERRLLFSKCALTEPIKKRRAVVAVVGCSAHWKEIRMKRKGDFTL